MEPLIQKSLSNPESDAKIVNAACDLVDSLRGARVAPEITSKIILLQKAIETGISSPEKTIEVIKILFIPACWVKFILPRIWNFNSYSYIPTLV